MPSQTGIGAARHLPAPPLTPSFRASPQLAVVQEAIPPFAAAANQAGE